jgi:hypothetical protein
MTNHDSLIRHFLLLPALVALVMTLSLAPAASAQAPTSQGNDNDVMRGELASFDRFMDGHPEIAEQLRKDPSLATNKEFVDNHPALQEYLQQHPEAREEIGENPNGFMHHEQRFDQRQDQSGDRRDDDVTRRELGNFDRFMDGHPEIAEQLHKDPSLVKNKEFVENHPALQEYLQQHPEVREEVSENPNGFMHQEQRFDQRQDRREDWRDDHRDHDFDRAETEGFGHFLGDHSGVASELSKNPSLANNQEFVESHPDLQQYLKEHPAAQKQLMANPQTFVQSAQQSTNSTSAPKTPVLNPQPKQQK